MWKWADVTFELIIEMSSSITISDVYKLTLVQDLTDDLKRLSRVTHQQYDVHVS